VSIVRVRRFALVPMLAGLLVGNAQGVGAPPVPTPAPGAPGELEIVVTGERGRLAQRIDAFVASVTAETGNSQVARWDRRVCLNIVGVSAGQRDFFGAEIAAAGAPVGLEILPNRSCETSAYVIFSANPDRLLSRLGETHPRFFGDIPLDRRRELRSASSPVRWLSHAQLRGAAGEMPSAFSADIGKGGVERTVPALRAIPSRLQNGSRMDLQSMIAIVDTSQLAGVSNRSLAAFLAMVVLGNVRPDYRVSEANSILSLFEAAGPGALVTDGLTEWDRAYLQALYAGASNLSSVQRMQRIAGTMERRLIAGDEPERR